MTGDYPRDTDTSDKGRYVYRFNVHDITRFEKVQDYVVRDASFLIGRVVIRRLVVGWLIALLESI